MAAYINYRTTSGLTLTVKIWKNGVVTHNALELPEVSGGYYRVAFPDQTEGNYFAEVYEGSELAGAGEQVIEAPTTNQIEVITGVVGSSPTVSAFTCSTLSTLDDFYNGSVLTFTSGENLGIARKISNYIGGTKTLQFAFAFPTIPAQNDTFSILGRIE